MESNIDLIEKIRRGLIGLLSDFRWKVKGFIEEDYTLYPLPKDPAIVTSVIEEIIKSKVKTYLKKQYRCSIKQGGSREYPEIAIFGGLLGASKIAIDIKTTRRISKNRISGFTLGSYAGYFYHSNVKMPGCIMPYDDFSEHLVIGFMYDWDGKANTLNMVKNIDLIVQPKWKIASKSTGTGTTNAIGSIKNINDLREGRGVFKSQEEFNAFWKQKAKFKKTNNRL